MQRDEVVDDLLSAWRRVLEGAAEVTVLQGEAGMGRTTVLDALADAVDGPVVRVAGYGGVEAPRLAVVETILAHLRDPDPSAVVAEDVLPAAHRLRRAIGRAAALDPFLLLVDDAQDLDPASRQVLAMVLLWLTDEAVLAVVSTRPRALGFTTADGFTVTDLPPLGEEVATQVLQDASPVRIAPQVLPRLLDLAGGNPLVLGRLPNLLPQQVLRGRAPIPDPLPLDAALAATITPTLQQLDGDARRLVDLLAVSPDGQWPPVAQALGTGRDRAVAQCEDAGLVTAEAGTVRLAHPLLRSTVLALLPPAEVRAHHATLAATDAPGPARLLHRAAATVGPDEDLAHELAVAAQALVADGHHERAGRILEQAVALTADPATAAVRRLAAAIALLDAGATADARGHLLQLVEIATGSTRGEAIHRLAALEALHGEPIQSMNRLQDAAAAADPGPTAARLHAAVSLPLGMLGMTREIVTETARAVAQADPGTPTWTTAAITHAHGRIAIDEADRAIPLLEGLCWRELVEEDPIVGLHVGRCLALAERAADGEEVLRALRAAGTSGPSLALALGALGEVRFRTCRWAEAIAALDDAVALSMTAGQQAFATFWLAIRCRARALTGDVTGALADLELGHGIAAQRGLMGARYFLSASGGVVHHLAGDPDAAIASMEECRMFEDLGGLLAPTLGRWRPELAELHLRAGRTDEAAEVAGPLLDAADRGGATRWTTGVADRLRAQLATDPARALAHAEAAVATLDHAEDAFDHARALLVRADVRRRLGDAAAYRDDQRRAAFLLRHIGAVWPVTSDAEDEPAEEALLSAVEHQVMVHVAAGRTNRQIASRMDLSPKTVANHLYRIYRRLGVGSRIEALHAVGMGGWGEVPNAGGGARP